MTKTEKKNSGQGTITIAFSASDNYNATKVEGEKKTAGILFIYPFKTDANYYYALKRIRTKSQGHLCFLQQTRQQLHQGLKAKAKEKKLRPKVRAKASLPLSSQVKEGKTRNLERAKKKPNTTRTTQTPKV